MSPETHFRLRSWPEKDSIWPELATIMNRRGASRSLGGPRTVGRVLGAYMLAAPGMVCRERTSMADVVEAVVPRPGNGHFPEKAGRGLVDFEAVVIAIG